MPITNGSPEAGRIHSGPVIDPTQTPDQHDNAQPALSLPGLESHGRPEDDREGEAESDESESGAGQGQEEAGGPKEPGRVVRKIKLLNRFVDETLVGLEPLTALLWVVLYQQAWNGVVEISHGRLATLMGCSSRTIARHIDVLIANRLLRKVKTGGFGRGSNRYQLGIRKLAGNNPLRHLDRADRADRASKGTGLSEPTPLTRRRPK